MNKKGAFSSTFMEIVISNYLANCTHFKWIARDQDGCLCVYEKKPHKEKTEDLGFWIRDDIKSDMTSIEPFNNLFKYIKWEDEEPTLIEEASEGYGL